MKQTREIILEKIEEAIPEEYFYLHTETFSPKTNESLTYINVINAATDTPAYVIEFKEEVFPGLTSVELKCFRHPDEENSFYHDYPSILHVNTDIKHYKPELYKLNGFYNSLKTNLYALTV